MVMVRGWHGQAPLLQRHRRRALSVLRHVHSPGPHVYRCIAEAGMPRAGHFLMASSGSPSAHLGQAGVGGVVDQRLMHGREDDVETVQHRRRGTQDLHTQHERAPPARGWCTVNAGAALYCLRRARHRLLGSKWQAAAGMSGVVNAAAGCEAGTLPSCMFGTRLGYEAAS